MASRYPMDENNDNPAYIETQSEFNNNINESIITITTNSDQTNIQTDDIQQSLQEIQINTNPITTANLRKLLAKMQTETQPEKLFTLISPNPIPVELYEEYGYRPHIIQTILWIHSEILEQSKPSMKTIHNQYYDMMRLRMEDQLCYQIIEQIEETLPRIQTIMEEYRKTSTTCRGCHQKANRLYLPCGHIIYCTDCPQDLKQCVSCRTHIEEYFTVYY